MNNSTSTKFDQPVILRQPALWSHLIIVAIMGVTVFGVVWTSTAKIEQVVLATGQLKPQGKVKEVQAPINGIVKEVFVEDGQRVKEGETLVIFDTTASLAELNSLQKIRLSLSQENEFYRKVMSQSLDPVSLEREISRLKLPWEVASLARNRVSLVSEIQYLKTLLGDANNENQLNLEQRYRLETARSELESRVNTVKLETGQLRQQLAENQVKLAEAKSRLQTEQKILDSIEILNEEKAIPRLQYVQQLQTVNSTQSEIDGLIEEQRRLELDIIQSQEELRNTKFTTGKDTREQLAANQTKLAEIDSQLTKIIVENEKEIANTNSKISQTEVTLKYQELKAPVSGIVFDLKASRGFVPQPSQAEPLLKIVPADNLIAEVFVTNKDIGFVVPDMKADVRIDSFPFSEFGDVKGKVTLIASDALPPDQIHQYYRFPVKIKLDQQYLPIDDRQIPLQSGMSVSANIKIREDRTVLSLLTELFTKKVEGLKQVR